MRGMISIVAVACTFLGGRLVVNGQASVPSTEPHRNFLGDWSGAALQSPNKLPPVIAIHVTENKKHTEMRWDYTYGAKGEANYSRSTKWITLKPTEETVISRWKGHGRTFDKAANLRHFNETGCGVFSETGPGENPVGTRRGTFHLEASSLSYTWEIEENGKYRVYSKFEFRRVNNPELKPVDLADQEKHESKG